MPVNVALKNYPDWYEIERDTEVIIKKLATAKEIEYYLKNHDEYIRRLTIQQIAELKLKDSINVLLEILDDHLECAGNKELAAWAAKSICHKWKLEPFYTHKLLDKYTGNEKYCDLYRITIRDGLQAARYDFNTSLLHSEIENENSVRHLGLDISLDMPFPFREWFRTWLQGTLTSVKDGFIIKKNYYRRNTLGKKIKNLAAKLVEYVLYILLLPFRLICRKKILIAAILVCGYLFLTYTTTGRDFIYNKFNIELIQVQKDLFQSMKSLAVLGKKEFCDLVGKSVGEIKLTFMDHENSESSESSESSVKNEVRTKYRVTAKNGLNLRKTPSETAERVLEQSLPYNSIVNYLSKSEKDGQGRMWLYIATVDGICGWSVARWLEEIEDGK